MSYDDKMIREEEEVAYPEQGRVYSFLHKFADVGYAHDAISIDLLSHDAHVLLKGFETLAVHMGDYILLANDNNLDNSYEFAVLKDMDTVTIGLPQFFLDKVLIMADNMVIGKTEPEVEGLDNIANAAQNLLGFKHVNLTDYDANMLRMSDDDDEEDDDFFYEDVPEDESNSLTE